MPWADDVEEVTRVAGLPFAVALAGLVAGNALSGPWSGHGWAWWILTLYVHLVAAYVPCLAVHAVTRVRGSRVRWQDTFFATLLALCARLSAVVCCLWALFVTLQHLRG